MSGKAHEEFDLSVPAPNGLRRGRTTGTCATAAAKAALGLLLLGERWERVAVTLRDGAHYLMVPIQDVRRVDEDTTRAEVRKDGGDDPDRTDGATISVELRRNAVGEVRFFAGRGVGTVTQPGLRVRVGEPAINPVPRQMMRQAVKEVLAKARGEAATVGFDLTVGCENGETIAKSTFNPRLGVLGGISILGTTGIVEPMSLASWIASIEVYVRVALGGGAPSVAYLPGKIGLSFAKRSLGLPTKRVVQIANFLGEALDFTERVLSEERRRLGTLWLLGHPGKLAKVLDGAWDTHSSRSAMAMGSVARVARECGWNSSLVQEVENANTVEAVIERLRGRPEATRLWRELERRIAAQVHARVPAADGVEVRLFGLRGDALGESA